MEFVNVIALAFALAFDAFAVAVACGIKLGNFDRWTVFRLSFHFGFAQFGMPIIGWLIGTYVTGVVGAYAKWLAAIILAALGARVIWEQYKSEEHHWKGDPTRGLSLLVLMFATSVDALAAGFTLALVGLEILYPTIIIGVVAASMTVVGLVFGRALGLRFSHAAAFIGGFILLGLAVMAVIS